MFSDEDGEFFDRLFGPQIPEEVENKQWGYDRVVKSVDWPVGVDAKPAIAVLMANILMDGLGDFPIGWSVRNTGEGRVSIRIHVVPATADLEAAR